MNRPVGDIWLGVLSSDELSQGAPLLKVKACFKIRGKFSPKAFSSGKGKINEVYRERFEARIAEILSHVDFGSLSDIEKEFEDAVNAQAACDV